jgi:hypothetical protein
MNWRITGSVALALMLAAGAAWAHHSMSAVFDFDQRFTRTGTLTSLDWRNPHIYLFVEATGDEGRVETWGFEGPAPTFFRNNDNADKSDFEAAVGQMVTVDASRARDGSLTGLIRQITLTDGTVVSLCPQNC